MLVEREGGPFTLLFMYTFPPTALKLDVLRENEGNEDFYVSTF